MNLKEQLAGLDSEIGRITNCLYAGDLTVHDVARLTDDVKQAQFELDETADEVEGLGDRYDEAMGELDDAALYLDCALSGIKELARHVDQQVRRVPDICASLESACNSMVRAGELVP